MTPHRTRTQVALLALATLALIQPTESSAFDTEPNDSCAAGESVEEGLAEGALSTSSDVDAYLVTAARSGTVVATVYNLSNSSDDFAIDLENVDTSTVLDSATASSGVSTATSTVSSGDNLCVEISGSAGDYGFSLDFISDPPVLTDIQDTSGTSITSASPGDTVHLIGTGFGTSATEVTAKFARVWGGVLSATDTELEVEIPLRGVDGDVVVIVGGQMSNALSLSLGTTTIAAPSFASFSSNVAPVSGVPTATDRSLVYFKPSTTGSAVGAVLTAAQALDASRTGFSIVGHTPYRNMYQVEWSFSSTPAYSDIHTLLADLRTFPQVIAATEEVSVILPQVDLATDHDFLYDSGVSQGAFAQIGMEEARRLLRHSAFSGFYEDLVVHLVDDGLVYGNSDWGSGSWDELPSSHFSLMEFDGSSWVSVSSPGHFTAQGSSSSASLSHGTGMAAILGARSQGSPPWHDGSARAAAEVNANGMFAALDISLVNDDGDGSTDEGGESLDYSVVVYNGMGDTATDGPGTATNAQVLEHLDALPHVLTNESPVLLIETQVKKPLAASIQSWLKAWSPVVANLCNERILVFPAGNEASTSVFKNFGAHVASSVCPRNSLIVGGTMAGGLSYAGDDESWDPPPFGQGSNEGSHVDILAPASGFTTHSVERTGTSTYVNSYVEGYIQGTSEAAPLVAGAAALARAMLDTSTASHRAIVDRVYASTDDISAVYAASSTPSRLNLHKLMVDVMRLRGEETAQHVPPTLYTVDYYNSDLIAQEFSDLSSGTLDLASAQEVDISAECVEPTDVVVHPLGDVVYVLCKDGTVAAYRATDLNLLGTVSLAGSVNTYSQLTISPDGILHVPTVSSSTAYLESIDTYDGAVHMNAEVIHTDSVSRTYGAEAEPYGRWLAVSTTTNSLSSEDYDVFSLVERDVQDNSGYTVYNDNLSVVANTILARDIDWRHDGTTAFGVFYAYPSGTYYELYETDFVSSYNESTLDYCNNPISIAMDPDDNAFISCFGDGYFAVADVSSSASSYTPHTYLSWKASSGTSGTTYPTVIEVAPNGQFVAFGFQGSGLGSSVYTVDMATATGGGTVYNGSYDGVYYSSSFVEPRGIAFTPLMSISSPRPGQVIGGVRRLHVVLRDEGVTDIEVSLDEDTGSPTTLCTETLTSGAWSSDYDSCLMDTSTWGAGSHVVTVTATHTDGYEYQIHAPYVAR